VSWWEWLLSIGGSFSAVTLAECALIWRYGTIPKACQQLARRLSSWETPLRYGGLTRKGG
jgi:hypothetical protein